MNIIQTVCNKFSWEALIDIARDTYDEVMVNDNETRLTLIHANGKHTPIEWDGGHVSCLKSDEDYLDDLIMGAKQTEEWMG